jgi:hypothetical protein
MPSLQHRELSLNFIYSPDVVIVKKGNNFSFCLAYTSHASAISADTAGDVHADRTWKVVYDGRQRILSAINNNDDFKRRTCLSKRACRRREYC